ncbi:ABC transporter ATP-binding protein [Lentzea sp. NPDC055074]
MNNRRSLLEVHRLSVPEWARQGEEIAAAGFWRSARGVPQAVTLVARLAWRVSRPLAALAVLLQVVSGCVSAFGLLSTAEVFTALLQGGSPAQRLTAAVPAILVVGGSYAGKALLDAIFTATEGALRPLVVRAAEQRITEATAGVALIAFEDADFQELARRASSDGIESVGNGVRQIAGLTAALVSMGAALVTAAVLNPWLALVLLTAASADGWAVHRISRLNRRHFLDTVTRQMMKSVVTEATTSRTFAFERHALALQDRLLCEHARITADLAHAEVRLARRSALVRLVGRSVSGAGTTAAYCVLAVLLWTGNMPLAISGTAVLTMRVTSSALTECLRMINVLYEGSHYLELYRDYLTEAALRCGPVTTVAAPSDPAVIRLSGVSFSYPGQNCPAVQDLDLTINRGEVVALVGENGSGKTTLGKLVAGLYSPDAGTVSWDGVDLSTAHPLSIQDQIAVIAQAPAEWPVTAELAVRLGRLDHDDHNDSRWRRAVGQSGAEDVVRSLPHGQETLLSRRFENGRDLSGGQWQRLGIARGIYRDAPILIADEPTAALDAKAEAQVFEALRNASATQAGATRTTVLVTHRLANIRHANRIVVLAHGQIVEQGTHDELITSNGLYREMYETQAAAYGAATGSGTSPALRSAADDNGRTPSTA